jgi:hypothetical protein
MRLPAFEADGWCLDDGEQLHREAPETFFIPDLDLKQLLRPGDFAKLIFMIAVAGDEHPAFERMWVIVRKRVPNGYIGMLNNEPTSIAQNEEFWLGTEFRFEFRHIIAVDHSNEESRALANAPAPIPWKG